MERERNIERLIAAIVTLLLMGALTVTLLLCHLTVTTGSPKQWPPEKHSEIILEPQDEVFIETITMSGQDVDEIVDGEGPGASDVTTNVQTQTSYDLKDSSPKAGAEAPLTTSNHESPVKQNTDRDAGNRAPEPTAEEIEAQRQQQAAKNIDNMLSNRFSGAGNQNGHQSKNDGNKAGSGGSGGGLGMTAPVQARPSSELLGTVSVSVVVLPDGKIRPRSAKININGCSGQAGNDPQLRNRCVQAAYQCRFSRMENESESVAGVINFIYE